MQAAPQYGSIQMDDVATVSRTFRVGMLESHPVDVTVKLRDVLTSRPSLSITGAVWDVDMHDFSSGGQCVDVLTDPMFTPNTASGWDAEQCERLAFIWSTYHLNDMHAGCEHQRDAGWTYETHAGRACPVCSYRIGSAWKYRELPADVLDTVRAWLVGARVS